MRHGNQLKTPVVNTEYLVTVKIKAVVDDNYRGRLTTTMLAG